MTESFTTALIASAISMAGIIISSAINSRQIKQQELNTQKQLKRAMTQRLYELRLKLYPRAFEITDIIRQYKPPKFTNTKEQIETILRELITWKNGEVSLALSTNSLYLFGKLRSCLKKIPDGKDGFYSENQARRLHLVKAAFRRSLRRDVGYLFDEEE